MKDSEDEHAIIFEGARQEYEEQISTLKYLMVEQQGKHEHERSMIQQDCNLKL